MEALTLNTEFVKDVFARVPARVLRSKYAPQMSERWVSDQALKARQVYPTPVNGLFPESDIKGYGYGNSEGCVLPQWVERKAWTDEHPESLRDYEWDKKFTFPESTRPIVTDNILRLEGSYGLISDLHIPYHDNKILEEFCNRCYDNRIHKFVLIGDTFDGNQFHISRGSTQDHGRRYQDDVEVAKSIYRVLLKCFDSGVSLQGNHDYWFVKHMRGQVDASWIFNNLFHEFRGKVTHSDFEQARVISDDKEFLLTHGSNYSGTNPLSVPQKLSAKYEMGVVTAHQHLACEGFSYSGKHQCVCLGGAYDPRRFMYVHSSPSTNPTQTRSFAILKDGWVQAYYQKTEEF